MSYFEIKKTFEASNGEEVEVTATFEMSRNGDIDLQGLEPDLTVLEEKFQIKDVERRLQRMAENKREDWLEELVAEHAEQRRD